MEPGFLKPGNLLEVIADAAAPGASMEPGFLKPGNFAVVDQYEGQDVLKLQWSRAF